ncbi:MAG TPA: NAD(P)H-dependent glycerol-3-phosphate dehydrogenase [Rhizomicrobium sp.]|nr:NAD(P)H-dependent glycerol-3-phosphate dehydrogenase [Rhizomicrobium sp.]
MPETAGSSGTYQQIAILGSGAWGTALAAVAAQGGQKVTLWSRGAGLAASIRQTRENRVYLPGVTLPASVTATSDLDDVSDADAFLLAVPAQHLHAFLATLPAVATAGKPLVLCAKGIERDTGMLLTEVLHEVLPASEPAILSGPSFAHDVARGLPTAVTIAARTPVAEKLQAVLGQGSLRPYVTDDLIGVAIGGAAKNVYAIGCGVADGLGLGESARAALLARSFAELARLGEAMGARPATLMGLSGLGDLVLTATSASSRNFAFGRALGQGHSLAELRAPDAPLAEGADTAPALLHRARKHAIELPIAETLAALLRGEMTAGEAIVRLMTRPLKQE